MSSIIIKRCPASPTIRSFTQQIVTALADDFRMNARIEDGVHGEFTVCVDGVPVIQRTGDALPSPEEVEAAVRNAIPTGA
jgi:predicted Rdx family selenoprotein